MLTVCSTASMSAVAMIMSFAASERPAAQALSSGVIPSWKEASRRCVGKFREDEQEHSK